MNRKDLIHEIEKDSLKENLAEFKSGDTVRVSVRIKEGNKSRIQQFEGIVIAKKGVGISATFTVRKISNGVGVERVFPVHCPNVEGVKVVSRGRVRRSKLYYIRKKIGKDALVKKAL